VLLGKHVEAVGKKFNVGGSNGEFSGLRSTCHSCHTDDVTSANCSVQLIEITLVVLGSSHDLNFSIITVEVNKDKLRTSSTDRHNSTGYLYDLIFNKNTLIKRLGVKLLSELIDTVSALKLVRIGVLAFST
jgi:hypothetical protein